MAITLNRRCIGDSGQSLQETETKYTTNLRVLLQASRCLAHACLVRLRVHHFHHIQRFINTRGRV